MAVRRILDHTHPALRTPCQPVPRVTKEVRELVRDLRETMKAAPGVGLAAPQVGITQQVLVYDTGAEGERGALVNPRVVKLEGEETDVEGCLSIPGLQGEVSRAFKVVVTGLNEHNKAVKIRAEGYLARVLQHEIDHLSGVLFTDRAFADTLRWLPLGPSELQPGEEAAAQIG
ncbi:MAG TPA: peptide deformylase [Armatimonadota bacterium]|jgi:peptide deformylase